MKAKRKGKRHVEETPKSDSQRATGNQPLSFMSDSYPVLPYELLREVREGEVRRGVAPESPASE